MTPKNVFLFVLMLSLGITPLRAAEVVEIPDPNLRTVIENALGVDAGSPITNVNIQALTFLDASEAHISNLTGLEFATNLTYMSLADNNISDLTPLAGLTKLTLISLNDNAIEDISPLAGLTKLWSLGLIDNHISDISPLAGLT